MTERERTKAVRADAITQIERVLAWLENDEPLPVAGCTLLGIALTLMGKRLPKTN